jgi:hypothetical protein
VVDLAHPRGELRFEVLFVSRVTATCPLVAALRKLDREKQSDDEVDVHENAA